jgi:hypothetical protein
MRPTVLAAALLSAASLTAADPRPTDPKVRSGTRLTPDALDALLAKELPEAAKSPAASDELFLRRASLDLVGRPPTPAELDALQADTSAGRRAAAVDRLLASEEFGRNWANYWSDAISHRVPPPELTFLSYKEFKGWLAAGLNADRPWDAVTRDVLTAEGTVKDNPPAAFVGFHRGNPTKLAAETARVFLGVQLQCAECHNHKTDHWKRPQFHGLAAFFVRAEGKLGSGQNSAATAVKDKGKGEYTMPSAKDAKAKGTVMAPTFLTGVALKEGATDAERRGFLAKAVTAPDNPWFAEAFANRVWGRLMGRGFYEPVDDMTDSRKHALPAVHAALADHFAAGFGVKDFFRLVVNTQAYQREKLPGAFLADRAESSAQAEKLRGDEVFDSLAAALGLPNTTPPAAKATGAVRFPPPPKSTRDLVCDQFGFDPSYAPEELTRTLGQAMFLMNNAQVQAQIDADPKSGTRLAKLLAAVPDDTAAAVALFRQVLGRRPTEKELGVVLDHVREVGRRGPAFEDVLWGLVNSAEFTTRR